jgi:hypothetical protein
VSKPPPLPAPPPLITKLPPEFQEHQNETKKIITLLNILMFLPLLDDLLL